MVASRFGGRPVIEQRRFARFPIDTPLTFEVKGDTETRDGIGKDISIGGMFIETPSPGGFGQSVTVHLCLPGRDDIFSLPGVVRWVKSGGMGVQFGLLGAVETHAITELGRQFEQG